MTTTRGFAFTDEQRAFQDAIRDFCAREAGTREQRDELTKGGVETHDQQLYEAFALVERRC